jgi:hypothetical protein
VKPILVNEILAYPLIEWKIITISPIHNIALHNMYLPYCADLNNKDIPEKEPTNLVKTIKSSPRLQK